MWTREQIKGRAKRILELNYWKAFLVSLVISIVTADSYGKAEKNINKFTDDYTIFDNTVFEGLINWTGKLLVFLASIAIILLILRVVVGYMLEVGGRKFFIKAAEGETNMGYLGYCFKEGSYFGVLVTMLLRSIYTFLWTLLLVIPGIIKGYAYSMVPYILADNPSIGAERAIQLSNRMTDGEKWDMFVLDLSFLGWYILGMLALGIGVIFVNPYVNSTKAELYLILRKKAIEDGSTSCEELNIVNCNGNI
ncbi:DUF975 family protein [Clostridium botulinum]|uniref:DUF975 family protein n=1 Tax=Clostridium botulinum TaxID=1491 RepID=UPI0007E00D2A|nr:DUF975 family protein [Clostridium botulinum]KEI86938.1 hypothetical protein N492_07900 [Clostridium botulinum B2 267]MBY6997292.1 DUF975 family protein [Clostridium botulinum]MBY7011002.1 DUF975 family protein [Clostridium botulinum]MCR1153766.1 DUF975 family protein [Clostridium botulinum]MCS6165545.1 DUF975 family protein [Clostridium botulinum]